MGVWLHLCPTNWPNEWLMGSLRKTYSTCGAVAGGEKNKNRGVCVTHCASGPDENFVPECPRGLRGQT